jgi:Ser/Thr protein kinase RdoA (MazF antagonist)
MGQQKSFVHRQVLSPQWGIDAVGYLLSRHFLPLDLEKALQRVAEHAISLIAQHFQAIPPASFLRLHGDCHAGNVLWTDGGPHFVDFDDCMTGPAVQDLWMLLSGDQEEMQVQLHDLLSGYEQFASFDVRQLSLIESLRTLRMIYYAGWLARRWDDPAFPLAFPWFNTPSYWQKLIQELQEQVSLMDRPPLSL